MIVVTGSTGLTGGGAPPPPPLLPLSEGWESPLPLELLPVSLGWSGLAADGALSWPALLVLLAALLSTPAGNLPLSEMFGSPSRPGPLGPILLPEHFW
jgi:hypothetical protein